MQIAIAWRYTCSCVLVTWVRILSSLVNLSLLQFPVYIFETVKYTTNSEYKLTLLATFIFLCWFKGKVVVIVFVIVVIIIIIIIIIIKTIVLTVSLYISFQNSVARSGPRSVCVFRLVHVPASGISDDQPQGCGRICYLHRHSGLPRGDYM